MDVTLVSPLHGTGQPMPNSARQNGAANDRAENRNRNVDYPDVEASPLAQLLCLGVETYGRWSSHCLTLVRQLARYKSKHSPPYLQKSIECACYTRWWNILAVSVQKIICETLVRPCGTDLVEAADNVRSVTVEDLLDFVR